MDEIESSPSIIKMYHGSNSDFDEFSMDYIKSNHNYAGAGMYFTDSFCEAKKYGKIIYEVDLDISNGYPSWGDGEYTKKDLRQILYVLLQSSPKQLKHSTCKSYSSEYVRKNIRMRDIFTEISRVYFNNDRLFTDVLKNIGITCMPCKFIFGMDIIVYDLSIIKIVKKINI